jgi:hypothetical protein
MPKKDDNFAEETFNSINNDLDGIRAQTSTHLLSTPLSTGAAFVRKTIHDLKKLIKIEKKIFLF